MRCIVMILISEQVILIKLLAEQVYYVCDIYRL